MRTMLLMCLVAAGCSGGGGVHDVEGPYTGTARWFYVSSLSVPTDGDTFSADLNGDGHTDNHFGWIVGDLVSVHAQNDHVDDVVAARKPLLVELFSDDMELRNDDSVGVRFFGNGGDAAPPLGATLHDGLLVTNRVAASHAESVTLDVPLFAHADPSRVHLDHYQIDLATDFGSGFSGQLTGTIPIDEVFTDLYPAFAQLMAVDPSATLVSFFDTNRDGMIPADELQTSPWIESLIRPDIGFAKNVRDHLSFGIGFSLSPCDDTTTDCRRPTPAPSCFDRVKNGDETDVDCGGSCGPCAGGAACAAATDCVTQACDGGACRAPSCSDGIRDGFEIDVDCGPGCGNCQLGAHCHDDSDCDSKRCATSSTTGEQICAPADGT